MKLEYQGGASIDLTGLSAQDAAFLYSMASDAAQYAGERFAAGEREYEDLQEKYVSFGNFLASVIPGSRWEYTPESGENNNN